MNRLALIALLCMFASVPMMLSGCGLSDAEINRIAKVTCAVIRETRKMDSAPRVKLMNEARENLQLEPYLEGDEEIVRSIKWGTCELLVLASPDYEKRTNNLVYAFNAAKKERAKEAHLELKEDNAKRAAEKTERNQLYAEAIREINKKKKEDKFP